jgi:hypothetical protein
LRSSPGTPRISSAASIPLSDYRSICARPTRFSDCCRPSSRGRGTQWYATSEDDQQNFYQEIRPRFFGRIVEIRLEYRRVLLASEREHSENIFDRAARRDHQLFDRSLWTPAVDICAPPLDCPNGEIFYGPVDRVVDKQIAAFGEATFKFTDTLKATVGLRVSKVDFTGSTFAGGSFWAPQLGTKRVLSEKPVTPKAVVSWQLTVKISFDLERVQGLPRRRRQCRCRHDLRNRPRHPGSPCSVPTVCATFPPNSSDSL